MLTFMWFPFAFFCIYLTISVALKLGAFEEVMENVPRWGSGIVFDPLAGTITKVAPTLTR
jgi:hypothetical protein